MHISRPAILATPKSRSSPNGHTREKQISTFVFSPHQQQMIQPPIEHGIMLSAIDGSDAIRCALTQGMNLDSVVQSEKSTEEQSLYNLTCFKYSKKVAHKNREKIGIFSRIQRREE